MTHTYTRNDYPSDAPEGYGGISLSDRSANDQAPPPQKPGGGDFGTLSRLLSGFSSFAGGGLTGLSGLFGTRPPDEVRNPRDDAALVALAAFLFLSGAGDGKAALILLLLLLF